MLNGEGGDCADNPLQEQGNVNDRDAAVAVDVGNRKRDTGQRRAGGADYVIQHNGSVRDGKNAVKVRVAAQGEAGVTGTGAVSCHR